MTLSLRAVARQRLVELARKSGMPRNDLDVLLGDSEKLLDRFAQGAMRTLLPSVNIEQVPAMAYDLAEQMMVERAKRLGRDRS